MNIHINETRSHHHRFARPRLSQIWPDSLPVNRRVELGALLQAYRVSLGVKQYELAEIMDVYPKDVGIIEYGKRAHIRHYEAYAAALGTTLEAVETGEAPTRRIAPKAPKASKTRQPLTIWSQHTSNSDTQMLVVTGSAQAIAKAHKLLTSI